MSAHRISESARKYTEYDMIQTHTELPPYPEPRARLLQAFLAGGGHDKDSSLYLLAVSLVQMGMDTHDMIDTEQSGRPEREMRARQLKVLAGDYFSSRFYHLLSQAGHVDLIRRISGAVCEVNRLKMNLYERMKLLKVTAEDYLHGCVQLKTELFAVFEGMVEDRLAPAWTELLHGLSRCEVTMEELRRTEEPERFRHSWGFWQIMQEGTAEERAHLAREPQESGFTAGLLAKYRIQSRLTDMLHSAVAHVNALAGAVGSDKLGSELNLIGESFLGPIGSSAAYNERR